MVSISIDKQYLISAAGIVVFWPFSYLTVDALFGTAILPYRNAIAGISALLVIAIIAVLLFANLCIGVFRQANFKWLFVVGAIVLLAYSIAGALIHLMMFACYTSGSCL